MARSDVDVVRDAWSAFGRGDVESAVSSLAADVRWYGADDPDNGCRSREDARGFIRQAIADGITAEVLEVRGAGDRVVALVQIAQPADWGPQPEPHGEVATVRDGEIVEMLVFSTVDEALAAAGLPAKEGEGDAARPLVELLYFEGCPSHERLLPNRPAPRRSGRR